jgi:hypothetical protein
VWWKWNPHYLKRRISWVKGKYFKDNLDRSTGSNLIELTSGRWHKTVISLKGSEKALYLITIIVSERTLKRDYWFHLLTDCWWQNKTIRMRFVTRHWFSSTDSLLFFKETKRQNKNKSLAQLTKHRPKFMFEIAF